MDILLKSLVGSRLYGLDTPESDVDHASIYIPTPRQLLLGKFPDLINNSTTDASRKNTKDDTDCLTYSLPYFVFLAINGKQQVIDMLHSREETTLTTSSLWKDLKDKRKHFYSKSMSSSVDFIHKQIMTYGDRIKANQALEELSIMVEQILKYTGNVKLFSVMKSMPINDTCYFVTCENGINRQVDITDHLAQRRHVFYRVDGGLIEISLSMNQLQSHVVQRITQRHHETRRVMKENNGKSIKWSEVSHALRVGYQVLAILTQGDFEYPLPETEFLMQVKLGKLDFITEIQPKAEQLVYDIRRLMFTSTLPERIDEEYWDNWLFDTYKWYYTF